MSITARAIEQPLQIENRTLNRFLGRRERWGHWCARHAPFNPLQRREYLILGEIIACTVGQKINLAGEDSIRHRLVMTIRADRGKICLLYTSRCV